MEWPSLSFCPYDVVILPFQCRYNFEPNVLNRFQVIWSSSLALALARALCSVLASPAGTEHPLFLPFCVCWETEREDEIWGRPTQKKRFSEQKWKNKIREWKRNQFTVPQFTIYIYIYTHRWQHIACPTTYVLLRYVSWVWMTMIHILIIHFA